MRTKKAALRGLAGVELDVRLIHDQVPVVAHDFISNPTTYDDKTTTTVEALIV